jgi:hypothetical protein
MYLQEASEEMGHLFLALTTGGVIFIQFGGTWNISQEEFFEDIKLINLLKVRVSYGQNGNALGFGDYQALATYGYGFNYTGQPGSAPENVGDSNLTWEKNKIFDAGLDFSLFSGVCMEASIIMIAIRPTC